MDLLDHHCTYEKEVSRRALVSDLLLRCVCCHSARQLSLLPSGEIWGPVATRYYTESLRLLVGQLSDPKPQSDTLTAVILLMAYEATAAPGYEHKRHIEGAVKLMKAHRVDANSRGLDSANFWVFVRHDLFSAFTTESKLQLGAREWGVRLGGGDGDGDGGVVEEDILAQRLMWLVGRAVDVTYGDGDEGDREREREELRKDIRVWEKSVPETFWGIHYGEECGDGLEKIHFAIQSAGRSLFSPFVLLSPLFLFVCPFFPYLQRRSVLKELAVKRVARLYANCMVALASAVMWYHTLHILLLAEPNQPTHSNHSKVSSPRSVHQQSLRIQQQIQYHATEILNICISNICDAVRCFSVHPLFFGQCGPSLPNMQFSSSKPLTLHTAGKHVDCLMKKTKAWILLESIQKDLGFHTKNRVQTLQRLLEHQV